jgi:hypothetical protein
MLILRLEASFQNCSVAVVQPTCVPLMQGVLPSSVDAAETGQHDDPIASDTSSEGPTQAAGAMEEDDQVRAEFP